MKRRWLGALSRLALPATLLWTLAALLWFVAQVDDVGGRPLTVLWSADPGMYDPQHTSNAVAADVFRYVCEPLFYEDGQGIVRGLLA